MKGSEQEFNTTGITASEAEKEAYRDIVEFMRDCPIPDSMILGNLNLFMTRSSLSRILFMHELYKKILNTHGIIIEFGVRWGQNLALLTEFRNMFEPYNYNRRIVGFDTFEGFAGISSNDGNYDTLAEKSLSVPPGYEDRLSRLLSSHEKLGPRGHITKYELVKGDVRETLPLWLENHPETIISLAYFDMDLYEPTRKCIECIQPYLTKRSVLGFDELNLRRYPGETIALRESLGLPNCRIHRNPLSINQSYLTFE